MARRFVTSRLEIDMTFVTKLRELSEEAREHLKETDREHQYEVNQLLSEILDHQWQELTKQMEAAAKLGAYGTILTITDDKLLQRQLHHLSEALSKYLMNKAPGLHLDKRALKDTKIEGSTFSFHISWYDNI